MGESLGLFLLPGGLPPEASQAQLLVLDFHLEFIFTWEGEKKMKTKNADGDQRWVLAFLQAHIRAPEPPPLWMKQGRDIPENMGSETSFLNPPPLGWNKGRDITANSGQKIDFSTPPFG